MGTSKRKRSLSYANQQREKSIELIRAGFFEMDSRIGEYRVKMRPFVLIDCRKNLFPGIVSDVEEYFVKNQITWWGGCKPTAHTLSSQIACLNHLFPIRQDKKAVLSLLNTASSDFEDLYKIDEYKPGYISLKLLVG